MDFIKRGVDVVRQIKLVSFDAQLVSNIPNNPGTLSTIRAVLDGNLEGNTHHFFFNKKIAQTGVSYLFTPDGRRLRRNQDFGDTPYDEDACKKDFGSVSVSESVTRIL